MMDNNWRTWVILVIAFVGLSFEALKHLPVKDSVSWTAENIKYGMDGKPYSVRILPTAGHRLPVPKYTHVAGDNQLLQSELKKFVAGTKPAKTEAKDKAAVKKKKKKDDDEYEDVIDPITGKLVHRKKKKDAKKDEPATPVAATANYEPATPAPDGNENAAIAAAVAEAAQSGAIPLSPGGQQSADPFSSLQEWEHLLLSRPDLSETKLFIQDYKSHTVSSDIYYQITQMMISDSRPEMKQLGVMCAGAVQSVLSFQILAGVTKNSAAGATLQSQAVAFISQYARQLSNLPILLNILKGSDPTSATFAAKDVDAAAQQFLTPTSAAPTSGPGALGTATANAAQFQPFLTVLAQLSTNNQNPSLSAQAGQTLSDLQARLGISGTSNVASTP